jgi:hypothetical protein
MVNFAQTSLFRPVVEMRGMAPYFPETADDGYARQGE